MTSGYKSGDFIVVSVGDIENQFEIVGVEGGMIRLLDTVSLVTSSRRIIELNELVLSGTANILPKNQIERRLKDPWALDFEGYAEEEKVEARRRFQYIRALATVKSYTPKYVDPIRNSVAEKLGEIAPSVRTIYRWRCDYLEAGHSIKGLVPKTKSKGNRRPKLKKPAENYIQKAIAHFKQSMVPSFSSSYDHMETLINFDNRLLPEYEKLKVPTLPTLIKRLEKESPAKVMEARFGKEKVKRTFKQSKLVREIKLILQRVEVDHTKLDLFVVDDENGIVLGRPWITVFLDYKSKSILGFYIGFENPSYLSVAKALHHAISSKAYIKEMYPSVENEWLCAGSPALIATDRGKEFISVAFDDACMDLDIIIQHNPGKHPWYKGSIESYFRGLNQRLLNDKPGRVMGRISGVVDYQPEKHAIISIKAFLEIFHIWVVDIYQCDKVAGGTIIPNKAWKEDLDSVPIVPVNPVRLEIALAERFEASLTGIGIKKDYIVYDSDELTKYRMRFGFGKISIKRDRENLGHIYLYDKYAKSYFKVAAVNQKYAAGLTAYQHKIHKKFVKKVLNDEIDMESLAVAKMKIIAIVEEEFAARKKNKISTKQRVARYVGIGQQKGMVAKTSVADEASSKNAGVPKPKHSSAKLKSRAASNLPISEFDGTDNDFPDELDF